MNSKRKGGFKQLNSKLEPIYKFTKSLNLILGIIFGLDPLMCHEKGLRSNNGDSFRDGISLPTWFSRLLNLILTLIFGSPSNSSEVPPSGVDRW